MPRAGRSRSRLLGAPKGLAAEAGLSGRPESVALAVGQPRRPMSRRLGVFALVSRIQRTTWCTSDTEKGGEGFEGPKQSRGV